MGSSRAYFKLWNALLLKYAVNISALALDTYVANLNIANQYGEACAKSLAKS